MKSPEYVRDVTARWRALLDEGRNADKRDMEYLAGVFGRSGHTDAYYLRKIDSKMLGVRRESDKKESAAQAKFESITRKIPIELFASIKRGEPSRLRARVGEKCVTVLGATPDEARTQPITEESLRKNLSKLGDTVYYLKNLSAELDEGLMLPISAINALRRAAIEALKNENNESARSEADILQANQSYPSKKREKIRTAVFYQPENIPDVARDFFDRIYIPLERYSEFSSYGYGVMLPEVIFDSERENVEKMLADAYKKGARDALIGNIGHVDLVKNQGFSLHGDLRLNVFNNSTAAELEALGIQDFILSPELTLRQMRDVGGFSLACVYGRLPLMITEKCVGRELGGCKVCESGTATLVDRRSVEFPVLKRYPHRSAIFNSLPTYMVDKASDLKSAGIISEHFIFTVESPSEVSSVIAAYKNFSPPVELCRRIK